jgi:flagellar biosynthesis protein FlhF
MQVRSYRARSLKEALQMVQHELGPETKIVQTRELRTGWWERFARGRHFEIRARRPGPRPLPLRRRGGELPDSEQVLERLPAARAEDAWSFRQHVRTHSDHQVMSAESGGDPLNQPLTPPTAVSATDDTPWRELLAEMLDAGVPESSAREWVHRVREQFDGSAPPLAEQRQTLLAQLAREVTTCAPNSASPGQRRVVALVGPTGVGKTTTIAKLAAKLRLHEHRCVGLITLDTYRVAAVQQLRTYAEIMDVPLEVVSTPQDMNAALARLIDLDVVLIDTAGYSPRDTLRLQQLKSLLAEARPDELHLVVSAASSVEHLHQVVHRFTPLGVSAMTISKLDEATGLGHVLPVLHACRLPVSYLTCGPSVPEDLVVAESAQLLPVLLGHAPISALI